MLGLILKRACVEQIQQNHKSRPNFIDKSVKYVGPMVTTVVRY